MGRAELQNIHPLRRDAIRDADAIVTTNEVTDRHGTGVILGRIFGSSPNILSVRSENLYPEHHLGAAQLSFAHEGLSRQQSFARVMYALNGCTVRRVLCVPFKPDELITALVLKELFGAPLCTFVMDDNNIFSHGIADELMQEVLSKSELRLAISPEMRDAYEAKYNLKFFILPPVVASNSVQTCPHIPSGQKVQERTGVLVGNIWSRNWLEQLRQTVRSAGLRLDWYGNASANWLKTNPADLRKDGIVDCGFLPERELTARVRDYPYALIPSGSLDEKGDRPEIARLSLPTRMPYLMAALNMPMIVLGSPNTGAARFLERFGVGRTTPYHGEGLRQTVEEICQPATQVALRRRAADRGTLFGAANLDDWIWRSLEQGEPCDERFEEAFGRPHSEMAMFLDAPAPKDLQRDHLPAFHALRRLRKQGFAPDFVLDVGASTGVWSDMAHRLFPQARFILIEPLYEKYARQSDWFFKKHPEFECLPVAVSDQAGEAELSVSSDLYGSSLLHPSDFRVYEPQRVAVRTLDEIAHEKNLTGQGLLKMDVQFAEHLVLNGAKRLMPQVDALLVELSLVRYADQPMIFPEMCEMIRALGFRYYEDAGGWRCPVDGTALQKDVLFVRENLFVYRRGKSASDRRAQQRNPAALREAPEPVAPV